MSTRSLAIVAVLYAVAGLVTFGRAAAHTDREHTACEAQVHPAGEFHFCPERATAFGIFDGIFWPLYWSWELQK